MLPISWILWWTLVETTLAACTEPDLSAAHIVVSSTPAPSLLMSGFAVSLTCAEGYSGVATATACEAAGSAYNISLNTCAATCTEPDLSAAHVVASSTRELSLLMSDFAVRLTCVEGYSGVATATACRAAGSAYTISLNTCVEDCVAPSSWPDNAIPAEKSLSFYEDQFLVSLTCSNGFSGNQLQAKACSTPGGPYKISGSCVANCVPPSPLPANVIIMATNLSPVESQFFAAATCFSRFSPNELSTAVCNSPGRAYTISGFCQEDCVAPQNLLARHILVTEENLSSVRRFSVTSKCMGGYYGSLNTTMCDEPGGEYKVEGECFEEACTTPNLKSAHVKVVSARSNRLERPRFSILLECAQGYNGKAVASVCPEAGMPYLIVNNSCGLVPTLRPPRHKGLRKQCEGPCWYDSDCMGPLSCYRRRKPSDVVPGCGPSGYSYIRRWRYFHLFNYCYDKRDEVCATPDLSSVNARVSVERQANLSRLAFNVSLKCAEGYEGTVTASVCPLRGTPYQIETNTCEEMCAWPDSSVFGLKVKPSGLSNLRRANFSVSLQCADGCDGSVSATVCPSAGTPFVISRNSCGYSTLNNQTCNAINRRCKECAGPCSRDTECEGFLKCFRQWDAANVVPGCSPIGHASNSRNYCYDEHEDACLTPDLESEHVRVVVTGKLGLLRPTFNVSVECSHGYTGSATASVCPAPGTVYIIANNTCEEACTTPDLSSVNVQINASEVQNLSRANFNVSLECAEGYEGNATASVCSSKNTPYNVAQNCSCAKGTVFSTFKQKCDRIVSCSDFGTDCWNCTYRRQPCASNVSGKIGMCFLMRNHSPKCIAMSRRLIAQEHEIAKPRPSALYI